MWITGAPEREAISSASVVLPDPAGPSTQISRAGAERRRARARQSQHLGGVAHQAFPQPRYVGTSSTKESPASSRTVLVCSKSSPDFAWRNHTRSPIRSIAAG